MLHHGRGHLAFEFLSTPLCHIDDQADDALVASTRRRTRSRGYAGRELGAVPAETWSFVVQEPEAGAQSLLLTTPRRLLTVWKGSNLAYQFSALPPEHGLICWIATHDDAIRAKKNYAEGVPHRESICIPC